MFGYFRRISFYVKNKPGNPNSFDTEAAEEFKAAAKAQQENEEGKKDSEKFIVKELDKNLSKLKQIFKGSNDVIFREFAFGEEQNVKGGLVFIDGLVDKTTINENIIKPLMYDLRMAGYEEGCLKSLKCIENSLLSVGEVSEETEIQKLIEHVTSGDTVFLVEGFENAYVISTRKFETRGIQEPQTEVVVRGPREAFTESLRTNTSLLRRKIKNPDLVFISMKLGRRTKTDVNIAYLKGVTPQHIVDEVKNRLQAIDIDSILESGYIEQLIQDSPFSIFPTVGHTEKPDVAAAKILEGRAAVMVDGTPFVLTVPFLFIESFQTAEDYYIKFMFASMLRLIRFFAFLVTVFAPATYLAVLTYHPEMIPTPLLFTLAASEEGLPFPLFLEMLLMLVVFEILREAGVRLPRPIGQAVSIVGALVIGQAAVAAGVVSDFTVIVIAITAISSFVVTTQMDSAAVLRLIIYFLGAILGGFGIVVGILGVFISLSSLRSFGVPYFSPLAPLITEDFKDVFVRFPMWKMTNRPKSLEPEDLKRQADNIKPGPGETENAQ